MKIVFFLFFICSYSLFLAQDTLSPKTVFLKKHNDLIVDTINDTLFFHIHQYEANVKTFGISTGNGISPFYDFRNGYLLAQPFWLSSFSFYYSKIQQRYIHTRYPYTQLRLIANTNRTFNEEIVSVLHSQNINKKWNILFNGESNKRIGKIPHQENRFHYLYASTNYQGNQYQLWANYYYSRIKTKENGGVSNPSFLTDSLFPYENAQVFLTQAGNRYTIQHASIQQLFTFSKADSTSHQYRFWWIQKVSFDRAKKIYTDVMPNISFYRNIYYDSLKTYDSLFYEQQRYSVGLLFANSVINGTGFQFLINNLQQKTYTYQHLSLQSGWSADINFTKQFDKQTLLFDASYGFYGYLNKAFKGQIMSLRKVQMFKQWNSWITSVMIEKKETDIFLQQFYTNHFRWNKNISYTTQYTAETYVTHRNNTLKLFVRRINNFVCFDTTIQPVVVSSANIAGSELSKLFQIRNVFTYHKILAQWHNNSNIHLPWLSAYHSLYIQQKFFKKILTIQLGADVWYHSTYSVLSYSPVLNTFYQSNNSAEAGFYPVCSVFLNASLKRARFFVKIDHLNHQWNKANFFLINKYPLPPRMLKFGIFWNFYD